LQLFKFFVQFRASDYILATEQQASESLIQDLKLTNMIADFIISLRAKDKKTITQSIAKIDDNRELFKQYNYLYAKKHIYCQN